MDKLSKEDKKWFRRFKFISEEIKEILIISAFIIITVGGSIGLFYILSKYGEMN